MIMFGLKWSLSMPSVVKSQILNSAIDHNWRPSEVEACWNGAVKSHRRGEIVADDMEDEMNDQVDWGSRSTGNFFSGKFHLETIVRKLAEWSHRKEIPAGKSCIFHLVEKCFPLISNFGRSCIRLGLFKQLKCWMSRIIFLWFDSWFTVSNNRSWRRFLCNYFETIGHHVRLLQAWWCWGNDMSTEQVNKLIIQCIDLLQVRSCQHAHRLQWVLPPFLDVAERYKRVVGVRCSWTAAVEFNRKLYGLAILGGVEDPPLAWASWSVFA